MSAPRVEQIGDATLYLGDCRQIYGEARVSGSRWRAA
jgi:hypothetical protein